MPRGSPSTGAQATDCRISSSPVGGDHITDVLQEIDQNIILHERCNEMVQEVMVSKKNRVLEGMLCGYKGAGKDSCQVTLWTLLHLHIEGDPSKLPHSQVPGPG